MFLEVETLDNQVVRLEFDAARATEFTLWHKGPGAADFAVLAEGFDGECVSAHGAADGRPCLQGRGEQLGGRGRGEFASGGDGGASGGSVRPRLARGADTPKGRTSRSVAKISLGRRGVYVSLFGAKDAAE